MPNDRLLDDLVAGLTPVKPRKTGRDLLLIALTGAVELGLFLLLGEARPDIMPAMTLMSFWWKIGSLGALAAVGAVTAVRSFEPSASPRGGLRALAILLGVVLMIGWVIDAAHAGAGGLWARLMWRHGVACIISMLILSIPPVLALGLLMRRGAPTDRTGSALAVGAAGAAWGAFVFVFNCPHDDPFYIAVWYLAGSAVVALLARLALPFITRW